MARRASDFLDGLDTETEETVPAVSAADFLDQPTEATDTSLEAFDTLDVPGTRLESPPLTAPDRPGQMGRSFMSAAGSTAAAIPKRVAAKFLSVDQEVFDNLDRIDAGQRPRGVWQDPSDPIATGTPAMAPLYERYQKASPTERVQIRGELAMDQRRFLNSKLYEAGEEFDQKVRERFKIKPEYEEDFLVKAAGGLGSAMTFVAASTLGRGLLGRGFGGTYGAPAALGAVVNAQGQFEDAILSGADLETALKAANIAEVFGTSEAFPIGNLFVRADKVTGGQVKRYIVRALQQGTEEAIQEAGMGVVQAMIAEGMYDPERGVFTAERLEEGAIGFTTGAVLETLFTLLLPSRRRGAGGATNRYDPEAGTTPGAGSPTTNTEFAREVDDRIAELNVKADTQDGLTPEEQTELTYLRTNRNDLRAIAATVGVRLEPTFEERVDEELANLTPEDHASPIPDELIAEGRAVTGEAQDTQGQPASMEEMINRAGTDQAVLDEIDKPAVAEPAQDKVITAQMRDDLGWLGYSAADINAMTPAAAREILDTQRKKPFGGQTDVRQTQDETGQVPGTGRDEETAQAQAETADEAATDEAGRADEPAEVDSLDARLDAFADERQAMADEGREGEPLYEALKTAAIPTFQLENVRRAIIDSIEAGRPDVADALVERAQRNAEKAAQAKPGVPEGSPRYDEIAKDLAERAKQSAQAAEELARLADLRKQETTRDEEAPGRADESAQVDNLEKYRAKAREDFAQSGVSDRDRVMKVSALRQNVGDEAADAYDSVYQELVDQAVADRLAKQREAQEQPTDEVQAQDSPLVPSIMSDGSESEVNFSYKGERLEIAVNPEGLGETENYNVSVSVRDASSETGFRYRQDMSRNFATIEEAKAYAEKIAAKDSPAKAPESPQPPPITPPGGQQKTDQAQYEAYKSWIEEVSPETAADSGGMREQIYMDERLSDEQNAELLRLFDEKVAQSGKSAEDIALEAETEPEPTEAELDAREQEGDGIEVIDTGMGKFVVYSDGAVIGEADTQEEADAIVARERAGEPPAAAGPADLTDAEKAARAEQDAAYDEIVDEAIDEDIKARGIPIQSRQDAEKRWSDGDTIYAFNEMDERPSKVTSIEQLRANTPDRLVALPRTDSPEDVWRHQFTQSGRADWLRHAGIGTPNEADVERISKIGWQNLSENERQKLTESLPTLEIGGVALYADQAEAAETAQEAPEGAAEQAKTPPLRIEDYTEKSIIVRGETKENKERIKLAVPGLRALWNKRGMGWVFPKDREAEVRAGLADLIEVGEFRLAEKQDFGDTQITFQVEVAETGEWVEVTDSAQSMFERESRRLKGFRLLLDCVNG